MTQTEEPNSQGHDGASIWSKGGAWVFAQFPLGGAALLAAMLGPRLPEWLRSPARWAGLALLVAGGLLFLAGLRSLGRQLTPFPRPRVDATLVATGAYGVVRHPLYGGGVLLMLGWALVNGRWAGLAATLALAVFFDRKAAVEERWLSAQFPEYPAYRKRVRRLIPWIY